MRAVIQRVTCASVTINGEQTRKIDRGILILLGVKDTDSLEVVPKLAEKCAGLRIFEDQDGKMNKSVLDLEYSVLIVSNFTLYADTKKGKRPSFANAAKSPLALDCYSFFVEKMKQLSLRQVETGEFGADMQVELINDGPVTIIIDTDEWK